MLLFNFVLISWSFWGFGSFCAELFALFLLLLCLGLHCFCFCCAWVSQIPPSAGCTAEGGRGDDAHNACVDFAPNPADVHDARFSGGWFRISLGFRAPAPSQKCPHPLPPQRKGPTPEPSSPDSPRTPAPQGQGAPGPGQPRVEQDFAKISVFAAKKLQKSCKKIAEILPKVCSTRAGHHTGLHRPRPLHHQLQIAQILSKPPHHHHPAPPPQPPPPRPSPAIRSLSPSFQLPFRLQHTVLKTSSTTYFNHPPICFVNR